jgi:SAM-dependent methyltransferase
MIVLGAGRGYDARLFARNGFTVTAVDFAPEAVRDMQQLAEPEAPIAALRADMFKLPPFMNGSFDYVLEYVTYCAIDPSSREDYVDLVANLLTPGGLFIGLIFPIGCHDGGPPFAVDADELIEGLIARGLTLVQREFPEDSIKPRKGREELVIMQQPSG